MGESYLLHCKNRLNWRESVEYDLDLNQFHDKVLSSDDIYSADWITKIDQVIVLWKIYNVLISNHYEHTQKISKLLVEGIALEAEI